MGGINPVAAAFQVGMGTLQMAAQRDQAKAAANAQAQQQNLQYQMLWQQQQQRAKQQRNLLNRQLASSRAALAAGGLGFAGGSGAALMAGMTRQAEDEIADGYAATNLQHQARFGTGEETKKGAAQSLLDGIQTVQRGYQVLRPLIGG